MTSATGNSSKAPGDHARETNGDGGGSGGASNFNADGLSVSSQAWGKVDGDEVYRVDLDTVDGFGASFITYGATLVSVRSGDKDGNVEEVTLQYDSLEEIVAGNAYYGSTVGRVCNRISGASFSS